MEQMQQQMRENPQMMQDMMNSPMMQQMMQNPQLMQQAIAANPQLQQMMNQNPELRNILNDPATMQQMMRLQSNPALMREHTRNADRAMQNVQAMPGGQDALARMYRDVQQSVPRPCPRGPACPR